MWPISTATERTRSVHRARTNLSVNRVMDATLHGPIWLSNKRGPRVRTTDSGATFAGFGQPRPIPLGDLNPCHEQIIRPRREMGGGSEKPEGWISGNPLELNTKGNGLRR